MIPISTALYDPTWFKGEIRRDKRGIWIGINDERLHPKKDAECVECTKSGHKTLDNSTCGFVQSYYKKISALNFQELIESYESLGRGLGVESPTIVLLVHETPDNPCSERAALIQLFKDHDIELREFNGKEET